MEVMETGHVSQLFAGLENEMQTPKILICPSDPKRKTAERWGPRFSDHNISYFVGLDATTNQPLSILAGDRNIIGGFQTNYSVVSFKADSPVEWTKEIHKYRGNIAFVDGSVQFTTNETLRQAFQGMSNATYRLAIP